MLDAETETSRAGASGAAPLLVGLGSVLATLIADFRLVLNIFVGVACVTSRLGGASTDSDDVEPDCWRAKWGGTCRDDDRAGGTGANECCE